jgi:RNA polymerase sigma factor (sigma-70 family)
LGRRAGALRRPIFSPQTQIDVERLANQLIPLLPPLVAEKLQNSLDGLVESILHEVFAASWRRGPAAGRRRRPAGRRVAHIVRRYLRNQERDIRREQMLDVLLDQSSRAIERGLNSVQSSPSKRASQREQVLLLANALARLPDDYHEVVVLRHFEGLSFNQVGERMGRSLDSVQKLWVRALARLRQELE